MHGATEVECTLKSGGITAGPFPMSIPGLVAGCNGAEDGIRTRDLLLGKEGVYRPWGNGASRGECTTGGDG